MLKLLNASDKTGSNDQSLVVEGQRGYRLASR
jgi:hypothetical protein